MKALRAVGLLAGFVVLACASPIATLYINPEAGFLVGLCVGVCVLGYVWHYGGKS